MSLFDPQKPVSQIVREEYRTADVFKKYGINYCCGGHASLADVCDLKKLNFSLLNEELEQVVNTASLPLATSFESWPAYFLIDYLIYVHHAYLRRTVNALQPVIHAFSKGHRDKYPYIQSVAESVDCLVEQLLDYLDMEQNTLFPYLRQIDSLHNKREPYGHLFVRTLNRSLTSASDSCHKRLQALLAEVRTFASDYHFPPSACTQHQVIYHKLRELDRQVVQQLHLEAYVLFPAMRQKESDLLQQ